MKALFRRQEMICGAMSCSAFSGVQLFSIWGLRIPDVFRESSRTNHQWCQWYLVRIRIIHKIQTTNAYYYCYIYNTVIVLIYHDILILKYHHALHTWIWYYLCIYIQYYIHIHVIMDIPTLVAHELSRWFVSAPHWFFHSRRSGVWLKPAPGEPRYPVSMKQIAPKFFVQVLTCWGASSSHGRSPIHPVSLFKITLWLFNIAMENGPFIVDLPLKKCHFPWLC